MAAEIASAWVMAVGVLLGVAVVVVQAVRCPAGPLVWVLYAILRLYCGWFWRWRSDRRCPFPSDGPALIIGNHTSSLDPLMLWMNHHLAGAEQRLRRIRFMMAEEYYHRPGLGVICRAVDAIPVKREGQDMAPAREALRHLQQGGLVGVFPEGRINIAQVGLLDANPGVGWLAMRSGAPVYPVFLAGVPGGKNMVAPFLTRAHVRVRYGHPIDLSRWQGRRLTREIIAEITEALMAGLAQLGGVKTALAATVPFDDQGQRRTG